MAECFCNIAAEFTSLAGYGIISANLRTNTNVIVTEGGLILFGPAFGDLSITAYAPLGSQTLVCPGKAGVSFSWDQRYECDEYRSIKVYFIPRGGEKAFTEGDVTSEISMLPIVEYPTFNASAASGPTTPFLQYEHVDGYQFRYNGAPIDIQLEDSKRPMEIGFLNPILPPGSNLYLTNFNWDYNPPNVPTVSYSFLFSYAENQ